MKALQRRGCSNCPEDEQEFVRSASGERAFGTEGTALQRSKDGETV